MAAPGPRLRLGVFSRRGRQVTLGQARVSVPLGDERVLVEAVHPLPPVTSSKVRSWRATLRALPSAGTGPLRLLAGDFNATLDHRELRRLLDRGYVDAADETGDGLRPTWPVLRRRPPITIDHVLADERLEVVRYEVHDVPGSDHRAVVAEVARR
jgi:endonuclease/exonuclease/phosphatase (EEP) superfamily protein YafD